MKGEEAMTAFIFWLFTVLFTTLIVSGCENQHGKDKAVKAGHAEYYLDANNERQWRWKEVR